MRLTTWNSYRGTIAQRVARLAPLNPDLIVLQECSAPTSKDPAVVWRGISPQQGVAVVATSSTWRIEALTIPDLPPSAVPVLVHGPTPFLLLALWTFREPSYEAFALAAATACRAGTNPLLPLVIAGDFNSSPAASEQLHSELIRSLRERFGLVSAYHAHFGAAFGAERHPTHYWRWQDTSPWHIDYVFVPAEWAVMLGEVRVGSYSEWLDSDHRPLTVDIAL